MYGFLDGMPFWAVYLCLFGIVFARAQATYWIGRGIGAGVRAGGPSGGLARRMGPRLHRAERLVGRYGPPAVAVSFITVGLQTAINLSAGIMRMSFVRYLIAMFVGSLAWAWVYSIGGLAVIGAWWELFAHSPVAAITGAVLLVVGFGWLIRHRRRRARADTAAAGQAAEPGAERPVPAEE